MYTRQPEHVSDYKGYSKLGLNPLPCWCQPTLIYKKFQALIFVEAFILQGQVNVESLRG